MPLSDTACRKAKPTDKPFKIVDGPRIFSIGYEIFSNLGPPSAESFRNLAGAQTPSATHLQSKN